MVRKADMPTPKLTAEIITAAIEGFESQKRHIDAKIAELRALLPGGTAHTAATPEAPTRKRKKFSAASRRKMAMAQKARWAKLKGESEEPAPAAAPKAKRKLSKAGKAAIVGRSRNVGRRRRRKL
jgi:peptidoglycan hydrolase CwlO-like protein